MRAVDKNELIMAVKFSVARVKKPKLPKPSSSNTVVDKFWHVFQAENRTKNDILN